MNKPAAWKSTAVQASDRITCRDATMSDYLVRPLTRVFSCMDINSCQIAFAGCGAMGLPMALKGAGRRI